ncbi:MAG TPA: hypothetical protein VMH41_03655 [Mycobacteriales bacterium]|nr:hypothetical protein [Mycobacteriales bacterium]
MTAATIELTTDDALAETVGDAALAALLHTKPADEQIPSAVWWLIAESLRTSVDIRRTLTSPALTGETPLGVLVAEATLLTDAALAELVETTGAQPTPIAAPPTSDSPGGPTPTRPAFGLSLSVMFLARMLVTHRPTSPQRLANTLAGHQRALAAVASEASATPAPGPERAARRLR